MNEYNLLKEATAEIKYLRQRNEIMSARLGVYDEMIALFKATPPSDNRGYSPDIVYEMEKRIKEIEQLPSANLQPKQPDDLP